MDKVSQVSFKSIKNTGFGIITGSRLKKLDREIISELGLQSIGSGSGSKSQLQKCRVVLQLDNEKTPDRDAFRDLFEKAPDPFYNGFLKIDYNRYYFRGEVDEGFNLNDKPLPPDIDNLPLFMRILTLLNKAKRNLPFPSPEKSYIDSPECLANFKVDKSLYTEDELRKDLDEVHSPANALNGINFLIKKIQHNYHMQN